MNRRDVTATLAAAAALAIGATSFEAAAQQKTPPQMTMERMTNEHLEKCFGVAARGRNDCAEGAHSCAGQAARDHDPGSFVLLPVGDCGKIAGGKLKST
jgi:uncharacterized membrane protein